MDRLVEGGKKFSLHNFFRRKEEWDGSLYRNGGEKKLPKFYA
jgi:hypothetical protein